MEESLEKNKKTKVLFYLGSLGGGGAERVASNLMQYLDRNKFTIILILSKNKIDYFVPDDVRKYVLLSNEKIPFEHLVEFFNFCRILAKEKPDVILSFGGHHNKHNVLSRYIFPLRNMRHLCSVRIVEGTICSNTSNGYWKKFKLRFCYSRVKDIICVSRGVANDLIEKLDVPKDNLVVIYNPVDLKNIDKLKIEEINDGFFKDNTPKIIAVGRLVKQKGYEYLLKAFEIVAKQIDAKLVILGDGEKRKDLEELASSLGIKEKVYMPGFQKNPFKFISKSDIFVLSSLVEGFPNALIEAMACNVPLIATRCSSGPEEIITDGVNGLLVPVRDEEALAEAIVSLLKDKARAERLAREGRKRAEEFEVRKITEEYSNYLEGK